MTDFAPRPDRFSCPACPAGALLLSVEMKENTIYGCDEVRCGASLWVPTAHGHLLMAERLRNARIKLLSKIRKMAAGSN